jgi:hypothetical protein
VVMPSRSATSCIVRPAAIRLTRNRLGILGMSKQGVLNLERYDDIRVRGETFDKLAGAFKKSPR